MKIVDIDTQVDILRIKTYKVKSTFDDLLELGEAIQKDVDGNPIVSQEAGNLYMSVRPRQQRDISVVRKVGDKPFYMEKWIYANGNIVWHLKEEETND